jgi:ATP-dependent DNA ligase
LRDVWRASPALWRRFPPPGFVRPCEPTLVDRPPAGAGWLHEVKQDGFRILVRKLGERSKVWSRRGADFTYRFPAIAEAVRGLAADRALIDGEAVVLSRVALYVSIVRTRALIDGRRAPWRIRPQRAAQCPSR